MGHNFGNHHVSALNSENGLYAMIYNRSCA